ncbi:MAG: hypothetical protein ACFFDX_01610 [Candidatus Odinarchaeota archaeon]
MSKVEKKTKKPIESSLKEDIIFEKIIQFSGWTFLFALILFLGGWFLLDSILDLIELEYNAPTITVTIFTGINSAFSFGLASKIKENRDQKKKLFLDWVIAELLFSIFSIFVVAAYQW